MNCDELLVGITGNSYVSYVDLKMLGMIFTPLFSQSKEVVEWFDEAKIDFPVWITYVCDPYLFLSIEIFFCIVVLGIGFFMNIFRLVSFLKD